MDSNPSWYQADNSTEIDTPALLIYPDRVKQNIQTLLTMVDDKTRLRPHVKTHKSADATQLLILAGINKFKCATIAEAAMLAKAGAADVLLAYQPSAPKVERLISLIKTYPGTQFSTLVDNPASAEILASAAENNQLTVLVFIDLNIGMNRTGIPPGKAAIQLYHACANLNGIEVKGMHAYDGHFHHPDAERKQACDFAFEPVLQMREMLMKEGIHEPVIIAGGSPTFPIHAQRKQVECSPGTFIFWDRNYSVACAEQAFVPAALLLCRIISRPAPALLCIDLGHKAVAAENALDKRIYFLNAPELKVVSQSEEHLVVEAPANHNYKVGDLLYGLPHHICPTVALHNRGILITNGRANGEWTINRER